MRLLVPVDSLRPRGGVERSTLEVTERLVARGHDVLSPYREDGALASRWEAIAELRQVRSFAWARRTAVQDTWRLRGSLTGVAERRPQAVWLNRAEHLVWGLLAARRANAGLVVHLRQPPRTRVPAWADRRVGSWLAVSSSVADTWREAGATRIIVVPNGIDPEAYPAGPTRPAGRTVLYLGRFAPEKGLEVLARAWPQVPDADLLAAGTGPSGELAGLSRTTVLPEQADVVPLLQRADVLVLPSTWQEPFGRVVIEALSAGVPVVASAVGGVPDLLTGPLSDGLVPAGDPTALAAAIGRLLDTSGDPAHRQLCRDHVEKHFHLDRTTDTIEQELVRAATRGTP